MVDALEKMIVFQKSYLLSLFFAINNLNTSNNARFLSSIIFMPE